ncbi:DUF3658 domain-containing protein [Reyranella soli]|jgi:hypothetical protein|uniref:DUF1835 domain-containing protein n=1 Tax=Reyranella soli TaxID=1230389 RepID=A0A512N5B5_9HYPH|nr:DUF3658 domain-containing protein [Reyranella soli]GEP54194.1 hypothetical protein RSO01_13600 [Reyranella soli]
MKVLHVVPDDSASESLREAVRLASRRQEVLSFNDDLSCGPIAWGTPRERAAWRSYIHAPILEEDLTTFWHRVETADERLVIWFGRHSASELAFFLALADRLGDRPYDIVEVSQPDGAVGLVPTERLAALIETARPITPEEATDAGRLWQRLRAQNAPFRIVTPVGLASAPIDHFDSAILEQAAKVWLSAARVIGSTMAHNCEPYLQAGDTILLARLVALVEEGELLADGDPWDMRTCRVRLPD